jgi:hypothetical protein
MQRTFNSSLPSTTILSIHLFVYYTSFVYYGGLIVIGQYLPLYLSLRNPFYDETGMSGQQNSQIYPRSSLFPFSLSADLDPFVPKILVSESSRHQHQENQKKT